MDDREREPGPADESEAPSSSVTPTDPAVGADRRAHNRDLLRRYVVDVLGDGKMDVVDEIFHEDVEMETRDGRVISGQDETKEYLAAVRDRFADLETEVDSVVADETEAMAKFHVTAVHEQDYFGVDPTNREVTFRVFSRAVVEDGKMIEQGDLVNPLRMQPPSKRHGRSAVLEQIRDGVVVVDRDGRVVDVNPVAKEILGVADRDVLNEPVRELVDGDVDLPGAGSSTEIPFDVGEGRRIVDVSASSLTDLQDERIGRILVFRDVTKRVRRRQQLEVLSRRNEHLDRFASVISHDLRNPLGTARGFVELARETGDEEYFEEVVEAHDRMETIIEELLTTTRAGTTLEETERVALADPVRRAWKTARTDGVELRTDVPAGFTVECDPNLLQHILENLFRNATDHNDPPLTVTVGTLDAGDAGEGFYVEDDGRGIPSERREKVFEHGYTTNDDGTGLGLSIVSEFVRAHGWQVAVAEGNDGGARFEVRVASTRNPS